MILYLISDQDGLNSPHIRRFDWPLSYRPQSGENRQATMYDKLAEIVSNGPTKAPSCSASKVVPAMPFELGSQ